MSTTSTPSGTRVAAALGHLAWTSLVVIGGPVALWRFFGWPLPTGVPDLGEITSTPLQLIDPVVILNTFVCLAWICWAILVTYVALDLADVVRGVGERMHRIGPFGVVAGKLVGSAVLLATLARPTTVAGATPSLPAAIERVADVDRPESVLLPHDALDTAPVDHAEPATHSLAAGPSNPSYVVQRGDSLWAIAEHHLGDGFRWTEIHDLNRDLIADPNLICTGWQITLPADASLPVSAVGIETAPAAPPGTTHSAAVPPVPEQSAEDINESPADPASERGQSESTRAGGPGMESDAPRPPELRAGVERDIAAPASEDTLMPSLVESVAGLTGATVLATGLLHVLRRRRRGARGPLARYPVTSLERSVVAASDLPLVRWVGQELAILGELIAGRRHPAVPVAVEFSEDTGIEILWDQPFPDAPAPWEAIPGAWAWRTLYDPDSPVPVAERPSPIPGLVTIGRRDGRQLMVNLEAVGTLAVGGDPTAAADLVRTIVYELATCDEIADAHVYVTPGLDVGATENAAEVDVVGPEAAVSVLADASHNAVEVIEDLDTDSSFGYRTYNHPVLPLPVTVVAADPAHPAVAEAVELVAPNRGGALVVLGQADAARAQIEVAADGTATLQPLDLKFEAARLPSSTEAAIIDLLDVDRETPDYGGTTAEEPPGCAVDEDPGGALEPWWLEDLQPDVAPPATPRMAGEPGDAETDPVIDLTTSESPSEECSAARPAPPRMIIKVLGAPRIVKGPALGRRQLDVIVFIACSPRPVSHEHIQDAIWGGRAISSKSVFNLIGSARTALGSLDGQQIIGTATRPHNTISIHPEVGTDLDLLRELLDAADAAPSHEATDLLVEALELVEGPPFDAAGYDWAITSQLVSEAENLIARAATQFAELAMECGDLGRARWAVTAGLRAIPGDEDLYRLRMRIEYAAGNPTAVRRAFDELTAHLEEFGDQPSEPTRVLLEQLGSAVGPSEHGSNSRPTEHR